MLIAQKSYFCTAKFFRLKSYILTLLTVFICSVSFAQQNETSWTLEQCLKWAAANNIQIKQAELSAKIAKNSYLQSKLGMLPTLSADASYGFDFGNSINPTTNFYSKSNSQNAGLGLSGSLPLFTGLQQINNVYKNKYDLEGYKYDYENTVNNTALSITNYFLQIVLNRELLKVAEKQLEISQEQLSRAQKQVLAGSLAETSLYELEAQKARDESSLISAKNNLELSLLYLKIVLQLADKENFNVSIPDLQADKVQDLDRLSPNSVYEYALNNQPSIKSGEAKLKSAQYTEKIQKGTLSPTLSMNFSIRDRYYNLSTKTVGSPQLYLDNKGTPIYKDFTNTDVGSNIIGFDRLRVKYDQEKTSLKEQLENNLSKSVTFSLSIPLFSGWKKMTNIQNSKLQYQITQLNLESSKNKLRQDIQQSYANAKNAADSYFANLKAYESSKKSLDAFEKRFSVGLSNNFELQQARTNLVRAESQMIQSKYTYLLDLKILDFYQGKPITLN